MSGQQMTSPEINSVHDVKILLCYILDKLNRPVTEEQLIAISEDSGVINYFLFADALKELTENGSVTNSGGQFSVTEKGRLGSEYFNRSIPLVFRKKLLRSAFGFFIREQEKETCECSVKDLDEGCTVSFSITDRGLCLMSMEFYAPDRTQAEFIAERIRSNPTGAYRNILSCLLDNSEDDIDVDKYI